MTRGSSGRRVSSSRYPPVVLPRAPLCASLLALSACAAPSSPQAGTTASSAPSARSVPSSVPTASAVVDTSGGPLRVTAGPARCDFVMSVPLLPSARASVDASGALQIVVGAYVSLPVHTRASLAGAAVRLDIDTTHEPETYCEMPYAVLGAPRGRVDVVARVTHASGRPVNELTASVVVP